MANYYKDNPDLRFHMQYADWEEIAPLLEMNFRAAADDPEASAGIEDYVETNEAVLELVGEVAAEELAPRAAQVDIDGCRLEDGDVHYADGTQKNLDKFIELGLMGLVIGRKYGGMALSTTLYNATVEMISQGDASFMTVYAMGSCGELLERFATDEIKEKYLPQIVRGATAAMAFTEPDFGSALGSVRTKAVPDPDNPGIWRVNGAKQFITNGGGQIQLVLARSEPDSKDARGLSLFLVERGEGVVVTKLEEKLGIHGSMTCAVNYDNCPGYLVGDRGKGLTRLGLHLMHTVRLEVAAQGIGIAQAAHNEAIKYARERVQFSRPIEHFPPVREMLVENEREIQVARILVFMTAEWVDRRDGLIRCIEGGVYEDGEALKDAQRALRRAETMCDTLTPVAKYYAAEMSNRVANRSLQLHGGYGYVREYPVERYYRDARITNIYEGTSEIQLQGVVGYLVRHGLKLLVEPLRQRAMAPSGLESGLSSLEQGIALFEAATGHLKQARDRNYTQLHAKALADMTIDLVAGFKFLEHAAHAEWKKPIARVHFADLLARLRYLYDRITRGERTAITEFEGVMAHYE